MNAKLLFLFAFFHVQPGFCYLRRRSKQESKLEDRDGRGNLYGHDYLDQNDKEENSDKTVDVRGHKAIPIGGDNDDQESNDGGGGDNDVKDQDNFLNRFNYFSADYTDEKHRTAIKKNKKGIQHYKSETKERHLLLIIGGIDEEKPAMIRKQTLIFNPLGKRCLTPFQTIRHPITVTNYTIDFAEAEQRAYHSAVRVSNGVIVCGGIDQTVMHSAAGAAKPKPTTCLFWPMGSPRGFHMLQAHSNIPDSLDGTTNGSIVLAGVTEDGLDDKYYDKMYLFIPAAKVLPSNTPRFYLGIWRRKGRYITWKEKKTPVLESRQQLISGKPCGLVHDFKFKLFGGRPHNKSQEGVLTYNETDGKWNLAPPALFTPGPPRDDCAVTVYNYDILLGGGTNASNGSGSPGNPLPDIHFLNHREDTWNKPERIAKLDPPRAGHTLSVLYDGKSRRRLFTCFGWTYKAVTINDTKNVTDENDDDELKFMRSGGRATLRDRSGKSEEDKDESKEKEDVRNLIVSYDISKGPMSIGDIQIYNHKYKDSAWMITYTHFQGGGIKAHAAVVIPDAWLSGCNDEYLTSYYEGGHNDGDDDDEDDDDGGSSLSPRRFLLIVVLTVLKFTCI